jgi:hypothetical protein
MNTAYFEMSISLSQFYLDKQELSTVLKARDIEISTTNKLIKKEVIDVAELMESVSKVIVAMNHKIDKQNK